MLAIILMVTISGLSPPEQNAVERAWSVLETATADKSSEKRTSGMHALGLVKRNARAERMAEAGLSDENSEVQAAAASALGRMGAVSARGKLRHALEDKDIRVVLAAANALYLLKDPAAYDVFYELLTGERKSAPGVLQSQLAMLKDRRALEKLAFETGIGFVPFGSMSYEAFRRLTHDTSTPVRVAAAQKLAEDPDPKSGEALAVACADKKWEVRAASADALSERGDPRLLHAVIPLLEDENESVRNEAAGAVIHLSTQPEKRKRLFGRK